MEMSLLYELAHSFLKVGIFGFGGGFAMVPLMQSVAVSQTAWLSPAQFAAAIALGQITPGPVAISATFIGYKVAGFPGAVVATMAVFTPSLVAMYLLDRFYLKVRANHITQAIMHGVLPVVIAIILHVAISMGTTGHAFLVAGADRRGRGGACHQPPRQLWVADCRLRDFGGGDDGL